jgi:AraC-like DNA-binding protein
MPRWLLMPAMSRNSEKCIYSGVGPAMAPALCRAGFFQFAARQRFTNGCVQSRALFWCKSGRGEFEVNGTRYSLSPHDLYVLPWGRRITYLPSERDPMYTAHVHLVPWYRPASAWYANVPHETGEREFDSPDRRDGRWPVGNGVVRLRTQSNEPLGRLMDYAVRWYLHSKRDEAEARALGILLIRELFRVAESGSVPAAEYPEELNRLLLHIERGFHLGPTIHELGAIISRSRSHVLKLFRRHLGVSAKGYIISRQLREARELLLSTTKPVFEVGKAVGIGDPYHFSKLFRTHVGLAPRDFRQLHGVFHKSGKPSRHRKHPGAPKAESS